MKKSSSKNNKDEINSKSIILTSKKTKRQGSPNKERNNKKKIKKTEHYNLIEKTSFRHITKSIFCVFNSLNNILYLIYSNESTSITSYNLIKNSKITELKKAHSKSITFLKHFFDKINSRDLLVSISSEEKSLKIWNLYNFSCIYTIQKSSIITAACPFIDDNINYIIVNHCIYDFNYNKILKIKEYRKKIFFMDTYYNKGLDKLFIIAGFSGCLKSYDYDENEIYNTYGESDNSDVYNSMEIIDDGIYVKMITSNRNGNIEIYDFNTGMILKAIIVGYVVNCVCSFENKYLFIEYNNGMIRQMDLERLTTINTFNSNYKQDVIFKIISCPNFGNYLISQGKCNGEIKLWEINRVHFIFNY